MEGFPRTDVAIVIKIRPRGLGIGPTGYNFFELDNELELEKEHIRMMQAGFIIDKENNVYVKREYGAWKANIQNVESIKDLIDYKDEILGTNPYSEIVDQMLEGYEYVIGPAAPARSGEVIGKGLYCKNYKEIAKREFRNKIVATTK